MNRNYFKITYLLTLFALVFVISACTHQDTDRDAKIMSETNKTDILNEAPSIENETESNVINTEEQKENEASLTNDDQDVVNYKITGENFKFMLDGDDSPTLTVKKGDRIRIEFTSADGFHDWVVDEFDARTSKVNTGETASVEFVADQIGTFEYYCSVGQHRANGMVGNLIVE